MLLGESKLTLKCFATQEVKSIGAKSVVIRTEGDNRRVAPSSTSISDMVEFRRGFAVAEMRTKNAPDGCHFLIMFPFLFTCHLPIRTMFCNIL